MNLFIWAIALMLCLSNAKAEDKNNLKLKERAKKENFEFKIADKKQVHFFGLKKPKKQGRVKVIELSELRDVAIPDTFDFRTQPGGLSPIINQQQCGSCWAYSNTATLRDGWVLRGKDPGAISPQYLISCDSQQSGCGGGYFNTANMFVKPKGEPSLSSFPETYSNSRCIQSTPLASISTWSMVGNATDTPGTSLIQAAMLKYQVPAVVTVGADNTFSNYASGIYGGSACSNQSTNHMTAVVGWDNEGQTPDANGNYPAGKGYWIMRNSWGASWGESGFMRIRYTGPSGRICNRIAEQASIFDYGELPVPPTPPTPPVPPAPVPKPSPVNWLVLTLGAVIAAMGGAILALVLKKK